MAADEDADKLEQLMQSGIMTFRPASLTDLDPWGQLLVKQFLDYYGINWELGDQKVGDSYTIKTTDDYLCYLDVYPATQEFMWCTADHSEGIKPDDATAYLIRKKHKDVMVQPTLEGGLLIWRRQSSSGPSYRSDN